MSTSSYVRDTTIDEVHNTQRIVVRRVRLKPMPWLCVQIATTVLPPRFEQRLKVLPEAGFVQQGTVSIEDW